MTVSSEPVRSSRSRGVSEKSWMRVLPTAARSAAASWPGIDRMLVEEDEARAGEVVCGKKDVEVGGGERGDRGLFYDLKGEIGLKGNAEIGERGDVGEVCGVELEREICERLEERGVVGIVGGEHAGGGGGGFGEGGAAIEDGDACAATGELKGEGEAHDAGAGDAHVRVLHGSSLGEGARPCERRDIVALNYGP